MSEPKTEETCANCHYDLAEHCDACPWWPNENREPCGNWALAEPQGVQAELARLRAELAQVTGERDDLRQDNARLHREADGFRDRALEEHERAEKLERALEKIEGQDRSLSNGPDPTMLYGPAGGIAHKALVEDRKGAG